MAVERQLFTVMFEGNSIGRVSYTMIDTARVTFVIDGQCIGRCRFDEGNGTGNCALMHGHGKGTGVVVFAGFCDAAEESASTRTGRVE